MWNRWKIWAPGRHLGIAEFQESTVCSHTHILWQNLTVAFKKNSMIKSNHRWTCQKLDKKISVTKIGHKRKHLTYLWQDNNYCTLKWFKFSDLNVPALKLSLLHIIRGLSPGGQGHARAPLWMGRRWVCPVIGLCFRKDWSLFREMGKIWQKGIISPWSVKFRGNTSEVLLLLLSLWVVLHIYHSPSTSALALITEELEQFKSRRWTIQLN